MRAALLLAALMALTSAARPPPAAVPRCCRAGQRLAPALLPPDPTPAAVAAACEPADPAAPWAPRVYAPARGEFLPPGRVPPHWQVLEAAVPDCAPLTVLPAHAASYALLANNGSLHVRAAAAAVPPARFCAEADAALVCRDAREARPRPLAKCCAGARVWDGARCVNDSAAAAAALAELAALGGAVGAGWPACEDSSYSEAGALAGAALGPDGALALGAARLAAGAWCAEAVAGAAGARVLVCAARAARPARHAVYGAALAVGALFLALTLLTAGARRGAAHHALHWRCQTHYVAALLAGDVLLAGTQLAGAVPPGLCRALAVAMHFLFLSAFFWLNTMCFNIWWTFRDFRPTSLERAQEAWRLRVYSLYAWGAPLALAAAAAALDAAPAAAPLLRPRFAVQRCWFYGDLEILAYFFGPVGVLLLVNLALFASTARQLTCGLWRRDEVKSTSERAALGRVCAKLVVVMGVTWGADVLSWACGGPDYVWYATDLLNALQGVLIFAVVGWRREAALAAWRAVTRCARGAGDAGRRDAHSSTHLPSCGESLTHTTQTAPAAPAAAPAPAAPAPAAPAPAAPAAPAGPKAPMETVC